jgi:hypothetical protein
MADPMRIAMYTARHAAPGGAKAEQHVVPRAWVATGERFRWWGQWGLSRLEVTAPLDLDVAIEFRRLIRRHAENGARHVSVERHHLPRMDFDTGEILRAGETYRMRKSRRRRLRWLHDQAGGFLLHPDAPGFTARALAAAQRIVDYKRGTSGEFP